MFWFFGDFSYGLPLFIVILVLYINIKKGKNTCKTSRLVGWFGFNGPLRQFFSLYRALSQREGERKEK